MKFDARKHNSTTENSHCIIGIKRGDETLESVVVQPQQVLQPKGEQQMVVATFWMVTATPHQAAANCVMGSVDRLFDAYALSIPIIKAKRKITVGQELLI